MIRYTALILMMVAACADEPAPEPQSAVKPVVVATCPQGSPSPPAPRAPRTVESIAVWATAVERARVQTEAARAICARRLAEAAAQLR